MKDVLIQKAIQLLFPILCTLIGAAVGITATEVKTQACSADVKN